MHLSQVKEQVIQEGDCVGPECLSEAFLWELDERCDLALFICSSGRGSVLRLAELFSLTVEDFLNQAETEVDVPLNVVDRHLRCHPHWLVARLVVLHWRENVVVLRVVARGPDC